MLLRRRYCLILFLLTNFSIVAHSQHANDTLISRIAKRFEKTQHLSLQTIIPPPVLHKGELPEQKIPCYSGKQVTIVAVYYTKPGEAYGRMLVTKRFGNEVKFDEHFFQEADYDKSFNIYYSLLSVYFPPEATFKNCHTVLQVYDKQKTDNKVWLAVLTK